MDLSTLWEIMKTGGSIAGAVTLVWRGYDAWDARRGRLRMRSTREEGVNDHFDVDISYQAKSEQAGLQAEVTVIKPPGATVALQSPLASRPYTAERLVGQLLNREQSARTVAMPMFLVEGTAGLFSLTAEVFSVGIQRAKLKIVVRDTATQNVVARRNAWVAPASRV